SGAFASAHSSPVSTPARGPAKPSTTSGATGTRYSEKRCESPLALSTSGPTWGRAISRIRARTVRPASIRRLLSPPPMRRDWPPASSRPQTCGLALLSMAELREARPQPDRLAAGNLHHQRAILSLEVVEILH